MTNDTEPTPRSFDPEQRPAQHSPIQPADDASHAPAERDHLAMPPLPGPDYGSAAPSASDSDARSSTSAQAEPMSNGSPADVPEYRTVPFNDGDLAPFGAHSSGPGSTGSSSAMPTERFDGFGPGVPRSPQHSAQHASIGAASSDGAPSSDSASTTPYGSPAPAPLGTGTWGASSPSSGYASTPSASAFGTPATPTGPDAKPHAKGERRTPWAGVITTAAAVSLLFGGLGAWGAASLFADNVPAADSPNTTATASPAASHGTPAAGDWTAVAAHVENSVVAIQTTGKAADGSTTGAEGSGVVWDDAGHIVTNYHVIADAGDTGQIAVLVGNRLIPATLVGGDSATDLAVLKIDRTDGLTPINRADSSKLVVGQQVAAIGNPLGLSGSVTTGIISAVDRPVATGGSQQAPVITNAIQTSAALNPGNSGGALVNDTGSLIGINSAIATLGGTTGQQSGNIGIGFAIPVNLADHIVGQLIDQGKVDHAFLGTTTTDGSAQSPEGDVLGAEVKTVVDGGPAAAAGVKPGDLITKVNDTTITGSQHLVGTVRTLSVGDTAKVTVVRDGKELTLDVVLGSSPNL